MSAPKADVRITRLAIETASACAALARPMRTSRDATFFSSRRSTKTPAMAAA
ncbi:hypothetical protein D3C87_2185780 [compost metagenome]